MISRSETSPSESHATRSPKRRRVRLKPISQQTVIVTGATSGIGLATARMIADQGGQVVLVSRSEPALTKLADEIRSHGGRASHVVADVASQDDMLRVADHAIEHYGGFDTWVNNAAVAIYGRLEDVPMADQRRLFEVNFWGMVHGSLIAAAHLRERGGAIINIGSILSETSFPLQGVYSAAKHAVKGYTDALRMELEQQGAPVSVTLIEPASIDTPYVEHARNYLEHEPTNPPPIYPPELVAKAIVHCAQKAQRELVVGGAGWLLTRGQRMFPRLAELLVEKKIGPRQEQNRPPSHPREGNLYNAADDLRERGTFPGHRSESSIFTSAELHPVAALLVGLAISGMVASFAIAWNRRSRSARRNAEHIPPLWNFPPRATGPMIGVP